MYNGFVFQVSNCQWTLDATVLVIDMKLTVKRNEKFCCCGDNDNKCRSSLAELGTCKRDCDTLFNITISPCSDTASPGPCSVFTDEIKITEKFGNYIYGHLLRFITTAQVNTVRKCSCTQSMYVCLCICVFVCVCVSIVVWLPTQNED